MRPTILAFCLALASVCSAAPQHKKPVPSYKKGQQQPDPKRMQEIVQALIDKGYLAPEEKAVSWSTIQDITQRIANGQGWQVDHAPDVRVLGCILGILGPNWDTDVCQVHDNLLDKDQRKEYFRKHPDSPLPH